MVCSDVLDDLATQWVERFRVPGSRLVLGIVLVLVLFGGSLPAHASLHTYHEQPGQTTVRSQQSLRDQRDQPWKATLFKRVNPDQPPQVYLRLVGFPGQAVVTKTAPLTVDTGTLRQWHLAPAPAQPPLPANVAQYDAAPLLGDLPAALPLTLEVPLANGRMARLVAAPYVSAEWLQIPALLPDDRGDGAGERPSS